MSGVLPVGVCAVVDRRILPDHMERTSAVAVGSQRMPGGLENALARSSPEEGIWCGGSNL